MASAYPGAVDALVRPDGTDPLSDGHAALHNATSDAVEAVQGELGVNPSGSALTVAARFTAAESATGDAQADATTALANAATADGKAVAAQADATTGISNAATAQATANAAVPKASYDAHTILAATTDNTPAAVTVGEQTIVGRKTGGNITALTAAEVKTLLGVTTGDVSGLGTAAVVDVPAAGNATSGQAVKGSDTRLTDARTPTAHKTSHQSGGSDEITLAQAQVTNLTTDLSAKAPLASPTFTGVPAAPTAAVDTNTTQVATTAFTVAQIADDAVAKSAVGNLLTANQASVETDTTGFTAASCTLLASASYALFGAKSLEVTATAAGPQPYIGGDSSYGTIAVTGGQTYTFMASALAPTITRDWSLRIYWFTSAGDVAASTAYSDSATLALSSSWKTNRAVAVAPANAAYASLRLNALGGYSATEVFYMDGVSFHQGAGGQWALPGTPITNQGFYTDESCGRRLFQWDANNSRFQQTYGDTGWRNVTSLVTPPANLTITTIYVRRINSTVYVRVKSQAAAGIAATVWSWSTIGTGFTPVDIASQMFYYYRSFTDAQRQLWYRDNITADIGTSAANPSPLDVSWIHVTSDAWPTTLPGSAVGSIPA